MLLEGNNVENTFIVEKSTSPVKQKKMDGPVTVLPEFLYFYFLYISFRRRLLPVGNSFTVTG
jgi:hypothetical protein